MGDFFYRTIRDTGSPVLWLCARDLLLHVDRLPRAGPLILAPTHGSPYDVSCLIYSTPRVLDFLSIVEMQRKPLVGRFYSAMNCVFVDRRTRDLAAARRLRERIERGRAVVIFPEGNIRKPGQSIMRGGPMKPGIIKLAQQTGAGILPCVLLNTGQFSKPSNWLPFRRWAFGINYGERVYVEPGQAHVAIAMERLRTAYIALHDELAKELAAVLTSDTSTREKTPAR